MPITSVVEPCSAEACARLNQPELCMKLMAQQPVVLLTEDDAVVAIDLSDALEKAGYRVLGPLATAREALSLIEQETPTLAIIDIMLKDGPCTEVVRALRQRG